MSHLISNKCNYFKSLFIAWFVWQVARVFSLSELVLCKMLNHMTFSINLQHNTFCFYEFPYYTNSKVVCQLFKGHLFKLRICLIEIVLSSNLTEFLYKEFIFPMSLVAVSCLPDLLDSCMVRNVSFHYHKKKREKETPLHMIYFKPCTKLHHNTILSLWFDAV